ncbi:hypothetical protein LTR62_003807 [Meristemomyces frigidus]|uniref:Uncharacterized protein n=1 Tax=Meristemomyces frigidus TaxID=1508187 RepID=A0AAN7YPE4_9PEZI|nr:hypothetical protein LTR62_003807 [Meristemomyces frigidus]
MAPAPSPHRFVTGKPRQPSPTKQTRPAPRPTSTPQRPPQDTSHGDGFEHTSQFAGTPRFSAARPKARSTSPSSPPEQSTASALRTVGQSREDVDLEVMLDNEQQSLLAMPTTASSVHHEFDRPLPFSPKRRRLSHERPRDLDPGRPGQNPSIPAFFKQSPQTPALASASAPRSSIPPFHFQHLASSRPIPAESLGPQPRPTFLRPSLPQTDTTSPLPEAFSPRRRGQKFVPGGMAATVQQWVVETGQATLQSRRLRGFARGEGFEFVFRVETCVGHGPFMVTGAMRGDGRRESVMLTARTDHTKKEASSTILSSNTIGVRAPTWDIVLEGVTWKVAIDWETL